MGARVAWGCIVSLTLAAYAEAKRLDTSFLRGLGVGEFVNKEGAYLRIPYKDENGVELAVRFRHELEGPNRFKWRSGSKPTLYGRDRLSDARKQGFAVLVEGESDSQTLWQAGIPAVGLPGATTWREPRDALALEGVKKLFVVREPDQGGEGIMRWLANSAIRQRSFIVMLGEHKDPSALYLADPENFPERMREALASAVPFDALKAEAQIAEADEAFEQCRELANSPDILAKFRDSLASIEFVGEDRNASVIFLALVSRLFRKPVSIAVKGPSSGGKSYLVDRVLAHFPAEAVLELTGMSERALLYLEEDISHRHIVLFEAAGAEGEMQSYLIRSLLSEGRLEYRTAEKTSDGIKGRHISKEGPTGLILTTTKIRVHEENETRLLSLTANDTREQTREIMRSIAGRGDREVAISPQWQALQTWLAHGERRTVTPFFGTLAELASHGAVRMRRDFMQIKSLVEAHALLHRATRERDNEGRIVATLADYAAVLSLVADLIAEGHAATVAPNVRETVEAVRALTRDGTPTSGKSVAVRLGLDESAASRRCKAAVRAGFVVNEESKPGKNARYVLGERMPDDVAVLPTVEELARAVASSEGGGVDIPPPQLRNRATVGEPDPCEVARLSEGIRKPPPPSDPPVGYSAQDHQDRFEEIAARLEYEEGLPRALAEANAHEHLNAEFGTSIGQAA